MLGLIKAAGAISAAVTAGVVTMGGWAVVTVKDLPEYFVAGQQYTIEFQVRQHGRELLSQLAPRLVVSSSERRLGGLMGGRGETTVPAVARSAAGTYAATFTAPAVEQLFLTIKSGFGNGELRLYPQMVVASGGSPSRPAMALAERGRVLFVAKGCNSCHANADLTDRPDNQEIAIGPALGSRRLARQYVVQKLTNPASQAMPDLGLSATEVTALAAFLSSDRAASAGGGR